MLTACSTSPAVRSSSSPSPAPTSSPTPHAKPDQPDPDDIPRRAGELAEALIVTKRGLKASIDTWRETGGGRQRALLYAMRQQRIYQELNARPRVFRRVAKRLPPGIERFARETVGASRRLRTLVEPLEELPDWETYRPAAASSLRRFYEKGEERFDVPWQVLASLNFVESRFGRILGPSSAGAQGPMQFIPSTWDAYGRGDINDPHDSIIAAARYLSASGAPERMRAALYAYNRSYEYVHAIRTYARQITRDERNYYAFYLYQVYVLTTDGLVRLTGPGGVRPAD